MKQSVVKASPNSGTHVQDINEPGRMARDRKLPSKSGQVLVGQQTCNSTGPDSDCKQQQMMFVGELIADDPVLPPPTTYQELRERMNPEDSGPTLDDLLAPYKEQLEYRALKAEFLREESKKIGHVLLAAKYLIAAERNQLEVELVQLKIDAITLEWNLDIEAKDSRYAFVNHIRRREQKGLALLEPVKGLNVNPWSYRVIHSLNGPSNRRKQGKQAATSNKKKVPPYKKSGVKTSQGSRMSAAVILNKGRTQKSSQALVRQRVQNSGVTRSLVSMRGGGVNISPKGFAFPPLLKFSSVYADRTYLYFVAHTYSNNYYEPTFFYDIDPLFGSSAMPGFTEVGALEVLGRTLSSWISVDFVNTEAFPVTVGICAANTNPGQNTNTVNTFLTQRGCRSTALSEKNGGLDNKTLKCRSSTQHISGERWNVFADPYSALNAGASAPTNNWFWWVGVDCQGNVFANNGVSITVKIGVTMAMFNPKTLAL